MDNPYTSPSTEPTPVAPSLPQNSPLASLGDRFLGALIDGVIGAVIGGILMFGLVMTGLIQNMGTIGWLPMTGLVVVNFVVMMAIQFKFLKETGQTIGKKVVKTRIVTMDFKKPDIQKLIINRYGFVAALQLLPLVGKFLPLVDALMVFKDDRRCLHDMIAGTQVVKCSPGELIS